MKAIILAAGDGARMRPLTIDNPKPLLKIGKFTLLDRLVSSLPKEVDEIIIVIRYLGHKIIDYCGSRFHKKRVMYVKQSDDAKGTFAALKSCQNLIESGEKFFVLYADDVIDCFSLKECLRHERAIVVSKIKDAKKFGVVQVKSNGCLSNILEKPDKPPTNLVLTNAMLLDYNIFNYYPGLADNGEEYLSVAIEKLAKDFPVNVVFTKKWIPIGYPDDLKKAEAIIRHSLPRVLK